MVPMKDMPERQGLGWGRCTATFLIVLTLLRQYFATKWMNVRWRQNRLCQEFSSCEALERWIALYVQLIVTKRGLASVLHSGESAYADLPRILKPASFRRWRNYYRM